MNSGEGLDMSRWHTCNSVHCRAGWAVHIAGGEGYELEKRTSTLFAAMQIFKKGSPKVPFKLMDFYADNETGMKSIQEAAQKEKEIYS